MRSHEIGVPRTARYTLLGAEASVAEELWLVCHGYGQLASRFIQRFGGLDNGKRLIVAPEALSRFYLSGGMGPHSDDDKVGASWMTREGRDAEIADQVTYLDLVRERVLGSAARPGVRVVGFGFSQGAATVCRWAARSTVPPEQLVLWGGGVPADVLEGAALRGLVRARITIVIGEHDPVGAGGLLRAHRYQLDSAGVPYRLVSFDGAHELDEAVLREIAAGIAGGH